MTTNAKRKTTNKKVSIPTPKRSSTNNLIRRAERLFNSVSRERTRLEQIEAEANSILTETRDLLSNEIRLLDGVENVLSSLQEGATLNKSAQAPTNGSAPAAGRRAAPPSRRKIRRPKGHQVAAPFVRRLILEEAGPVFTARDAMSVVEANIKRKLTSKEYARVQFQLWQMAQAGALFKEKFRVMTSRGHFSQSCRYRKRPTLKDYVETMERKAGKPGPGTLSSSQAAPART